MIRPHLAFLLIFIFPEHLWAEAPVNDNRAAAWAVEPGVTVAGTLAEATLEEDEEAPEPALQSVWYEWASATEGRWELRVISPSAQAIPVAYLVQDDGTLFPLAKGGFLRIEENPPDQLSANFISRGARFETEVGERIVFQIYTGSVVDWDFDLSLDPIGEGPVGDDFSDGVPLVRMTGQSQIEMEFSTRERVEPESAWAGTVWRSWTVPETGTWLLSALTLSGSAGVDVWRGESLETLESVVVGASRVATESGRPLLPSDRVLAQGVAGERLWVRIMSEGEGFTRLTLAKATAGDLFTEPIDLRSRSEVDHVRKLTEAVTLEAGEPFASDGTQWFLWEAPQSGVYEVEGRLGRGSSLFESSDELDPIIGVYRGETLEDLEVVSRIPLGNANHFFRFEADAGERFRIRVQVRRPVGYILYDGEGGGSTKISPIEVRTFLRNLGLKPANDDFLAAHDFGDVSEGTWAGTNRAATQEDDEVVVPRQAGDSVWHRWAAPEAGEYEFIFTSEKRLAVRVLRGTEIDALTHISGGENSGEPAMARMRFEAEAGVVHYLRVVGVGGDQGEYSLELKELIRPVNDALAAAISLGSEIPARGGGTSVGGSTRDAGEWPGSSSIWWKWTAPESGFFEVRADGNLGLLENGARLGSSLHLSTGFLRFEAEESQEYHFRVSHQWNDERAVELTLDRVDGLEHATRETAIPLGSTMSFSTGLVETQRGKILYDAWLIDAGVWFEWEPAASGWISLNSAGSEGPVDLQIRPADGEGASQVHQLDEGSLLEEWTSYNRTTNGALVAKRGFLRSSILRDGSLVPSVSRFLYEVEAGRKYHLIATPIDTGVPGLTGVMVNARPAGLVPYPSGERLELSEDAGFLIATISVVSPNGFHSGVIRGAPSAGASAGFTGRDRIQGDQYAGEYRVVIPWSPFRKDFPLRPNVTLVDQLGTSYSSPWGTGNLRSVLTEDDRVDEFAPVIEGIVGGSIQVDLDGADVPLTLELAISDGGGRGFLEGLIWLPGTGGRDYGAENAAVEFGPENRIRGDREVGIYRVEVMIPAGTPRGYLGVQLRDRAGIVTEPLSFPGDEADLGSASQGVALPVWVERSGEVPEVRAAVELSEGEVELSGDVVIAAALLSHPVGVSGGQVVLLDELGGVISARAFGASERVNGSEAEGRYEVSLPVPRFGSGGKHWVAWILGGSDGSEVALPAVASVELPDQGMLDVRAPVLTRVQVIPSVLDLMAGPGEVTISLGAHDDRAGLIAEVEIFDGGGRLLASEVIGCVTPQLDCSVTLQLPQLVPRGDVGDGSVVVILRDEAGRESRYGEPGGVLWPYGSRPAIRFFEEEGSRLERWATAWPGVIVNPVAGGEDSDGDGWSDLLEFSLGTDPGVPAPRDPLAVRLPVLRRIGEAWELNGFERQMFMDYAPAPWFVGNDDFDWRLTAEASDDLINWEEFEMPVGLSERVSVPYFTPASQSVALMRLRVIRVE